MGWDNVGEKTYPCPCGKSTYTETSFMDDWNGFKVKVNLNCENCKKDYVIYSSYGYDSGMSVENHYLVKKDVLVRHNKLLEEASSYKKNVKNIFMQKYASTWFEIFREKNKKQVWRILTDNGARYPALGTFYAHVRHQELEEYLRNYFTRNAEEDIDAVMLILNVQDSEVMTLRRKSDSLEMAAKELLYSSAIKI